MSLNNKNAGANYVHSCEICGMVGLSDDAMREHTKCHVEGNAQCPFCGLTGVAAPELLLHVNQAHLDYLTPENELMSFIDDQSIDGDSDSISDFRLVSPLTNGDVLNSINGDSTSNHQNGLHSPTNSKLTNGKSNQNGSDSIGNNTNSKNCDMLVNGSASNGKDSIVINGNGQGSPLRSQLGLKLKVNKPVTTTTKPSPLQCLLCPYTTENPNVLEEHINRSHFDPLSPGVNNGVGNHHLDTLSALQCPICTRTFESGSDLELHVNIEHRDILSPAKVDGKAENGHTLVEQNGTANGYSASSSSNGHSSSSCPVCGVSFDKMKTQDMELHIEKHFTKSPQASKNIEPDLEKQAQKLREQREFEMLRAQYGMDDMGNFREQSAAAMQRAVYAGEMSVADYYERRCGLRAAESHGVDDGSSCTKSIAARVLSLSSTSPGVLKSYVCSGIDHYASSYGDKGWGCGYRNLQMMLSSLLQNTSYNEAIYSAWGTHGPARTAMPSISRLQRMVEAAWAQGFDVQGSEQLGCKLYNTRKWIGATEVVTVLSWLRIRCELVDFHRPSTADGRHSELFNWVLKYFSDPKIHTPPLYLQHQGHSRTIIGIEQRSSGLTLLVLDPSHGPRQVAALGTSHDSLRLIRRNSTAMRAPQYQIVAVQGLIETETEYQDRKVLHSVRIPPDR